MQKKLLFVVAILTLAANASIVNAQASNNPKVRENGVISNTPNETVTNVPSEPSKRPGNYRDISESLKEKKERFEEQKCKMIQSRVQGSLIRYENNRRMNQQVYGKTQLRLERLAGNLAEKGFKVDDLKADLEILKQKIEKLNTDYTSLTDSLKITKDSACNVPQGEFVGKLGESRKVHENIIQDRKDIRDFIQNTIKPRFMTIRQELQKERSTQPSILPAE